MRSQFVILLSILMSLVATACASNVFHCFAAVGCATQKAQKLIALNVVRHYSLFSSSLSAAMYVWAIWRVSYFDNFRSLPKLGTTSLNLMGKMI